MKIVSENIFERNHLIPKFFLTVIQNNPGKIIFYLSYILQFISTCFADTID